MKLPLRVALGFTSITLLHRRVAWQKRCIFFIVLHFALWTESTEIDAYNSFSVNKLAVPKRQSQKIIYTTAQLAHGNDNSTTARYSLRPKRPVLGMSVDKSKLFHKTKVNGLFDGWRCVTSTYAVTKKIVTSCFSTVRKDKHMPSLKERETNMCIKIIGDKWVRLCGMNWCCPAREACRAAECST